MEIRRITAENAEALSLKNEPFHKPGRLIPALQDGLWTYRTESFEQAQTECFPDEVYDFAECDSKGAVFAAYEGDTCVGLAVYRDDWFRYLYLLDLKVNASHRGKGVGKALIQAGLEEAKRRGYLGLYTYGQDDNLNACLFYLAVGFRIGGFNNHVYNGTSQAGKADIVFYLG